MRAMSHLRQQARCKSVHGALSCSRGEALERVLAEHRELQLQALVGVLEIGSGELADALQAMANGVAVQEQRASDGVEAAVRAKELLEGPQLVVLRAVGEGTQDRPAEATDLRGRPPKDEAVRAEIGERGDLTRAVQGATESRRLLGLQRRELERPLAITGSGEPGRQIGITRALGLGSPHCLRGRAGIAIAGNAQHGDPGSGRRGPLEGDHVGRPDHTQAGRSTSDVR